MFGLYSLLNLSPWITDTFRAVQATLAVIMAIGCVLLIIAILASPPQTGIGNNAITGAQESYYTKNKGKNNAGRIKVLIIVCASIVAVTAILYFVTYGVYPGE
jgi:preprotein translocase subunit SecG